MCHNASLRLIELTCGVSHPTAHLWRHKVFSTIDSWQEKVMLSGRVWIDEMYFNDTDLLHDLGRKPKRGLRRTSYASSWRSTPTRTSWPS